jgi:hypothetical protein
MMMFQYVVVDDKGRPKKIWVCENCRKKNNIQILKGAWRLIDKCGNADFECDNCHAMRTEIEQQILSNRRPERKTPSL